MAWATVLRVSEKLTRAGLMSVSTYRHIAYRRQFGNRLQLNPPVKFSEKLLWRLLHDNNPLYAQLTDKIGVRDYVAAKGLADTLVPTYACVQSADAIPFDDLPDSFVLKAAHGSGWNILVHPGDAVDREDIRSRCADWLSRSFSDHGFEQHYADVPPGLIIEQMLEGEDGKVPPDYKIHCFNHGGEHKALIQLDTDRFTGHHRTLFSSEWEPLPFTWRCPRLTEAPPKPKNMEGMLAVAKTLSEDFDYVRVDLYNCDGKIYFGELTFTHESGMSIIEPAQWDTTLGDYWQLDVAR